MDLNHVEFRQPYNQTESEGMVTPGALNTVSEVVGPQESQEIKNHRASQETQKTSQNKGDSERNLREDKEPIPDTVKTTKAKVQGIDEKADQV